MSSLPPLPRYSPLSVRLAGVGLLLVLACGQHKSNSPPPPEIHEALCRKEAEGANPKHRLRTLNRLSRLSAFGCHEYVLALGSRIQDEYRHKTYRILAETAELFIPEGSVTDYVLESYEREYLALLLALAYYHTGRVEEAVVQLNRCYTESGALIYNQGVDPLNLLLQAALREDLERHRDNTRPLWLAYTLNDRREEPLTAYATSQLEAIDQGAPSPSWTILGLGRFPEVEWSLTLLDQRQGYFRIRPKQPYPSTCVSETGFRLTTRSWFHKIGIRHSKRYHPLVNLKSWIRLPIGLVYGIAAAATGASLAVGGCAADLAADVDGYLCRLSLEGGLFLLGKADDVGAYTVKPDLRHWEDLPAAFVVTSLPDPEQEPCLPTEGERQVVFRPNTR